MTENTKETEINQAQTSPQGPAKKILVVDDNEIFLGALRTILAKAGYEVSTCLDVDGAKHLLSLTAYDALISDIRMPGELTGIDLMAFASKTAKLPVILMTGFADLIETRDAFDQGAAGFLAKPFKQSDLFQILDGIFKKEPERPPALVDDEFCKVNIDDFVSGKDIQADVYIRLTGAKYVKIAHQGENIDIERIRNYKSKDLRHLYLKKADFKRYIGFSLNLTPLVVNSSKIPVEKKLGFLRSTNEVIMEDLYFNGVNQESFENAKTLLTTTINVFTDQKNTFDLIQMLNSHADFLYAHSLGVSLYATMIAREIGWDSPQTLFKLGLGALLHDIGKKELDRAIVLKARIEMSQEEVALYETHCARGVEILTQVPGMSEDVLQIVAQHHENCIGQGFPRKMSRSKINLLAKVVSVADEFCKLVLKGPLGAGVTPEIAIDQMMMFDERFDKQALMGLMRIFKFTPPVEFTKEGKQ